MNKKGSLQMLTTGAVMILIAIITVSIAISINDNMTTSLRGDTANVVNESVTGLSNTSWSDLAGEDLSAVTVVWLNFTGDTFNHSITSPNYSVILLSGEIQLTDAGSLLYEGNNSIVSYSYYIHGSAYNASASGTTGLAAFGDYWTSIVSIIILVVIVGLFAYFRSGVGGIEIR